MFTIPLYFDQKIEELTADILIMSREIDNMIVNPCPVLLLSNVTTLDQKLAALQDDLQLCNALSVTRQTRSLNVAVGDLKRFRAILLTRVMELNDKVCISLHALNYICIYNKTYYCVIQMHLCYGYLNIISITS